MSTLYLAQLTMKNAFKLAGLALKTTTTNENGQCARDCEKLWSDFAAGNYFSRISDKLSNEVFAVYHNYEGDHTQPFSYFIGCKVDMDAILPSELDTLVIPEAKYQKFEAKGTMPQCVIDTWISIWNSDLPRAYQADFEVYGEKSQDWNNAEIEVYISMH